MHRRLLAAVDNLGTEFRLVGRSRGAPHVNAKIGAKRLECGHRAEGFAPAEVDLLDTWKRCKNVHVV